MACVFIKSHVACCSELRFLICSFHHLYDPIKFRRGAENIHLCGNSEMKPAASACQVLQKSPITMQYFLDSDFDVLTATL